MDDVLSRRKLLFGRSGLTGLDDVIRPPWAISPDVFSKKCTGCGECVSACPEHILTIDDRKLAKVDFSKGECTFCKDCVKSCQEAALVITDAADPWSLNVSIEGKCLAMKGVECRICDDQCEPRAIRFRLIPGGVSMPNLDESKCTGCGACVSTCPTGAIAIMPDLTERGLII